MSVCIVKDKDIRTAVRLYLSSLSLSLITVLPQQSDDAAGHPRPSVPSLPAALRLATMNNLSQKYLGLSPPPPGPGRGRPLQREPPQRGPRCLSPRRPRA